MGECTYGGTEEDRAYTIEQTTDGGYITAGNSASDDGDVTGLHGMTDAWIVKLTANGAIQWQKALGGSKDEVVKSIIQTSDGGYLALGNTNSPDGDFSGYHASYDGFVVKLNAMGDVEWKKAMGGPGWDELRSVKQAPDGGFIIVGEAGSNGGDISGNHGFGDVWAD